MFLKVYYTIEEKTIKFKCVCTAPTCLLFANQLITQTTKGVDRTNIYFVLGLEERGNTKFEHGAQSSNF